MNAILTMQPICCKCGKEPGFDAVQVWVIGPDGEPCSTRTSWCRPCAEKAGIAPVDDHPNTAGRSR